MFVFKCLDLGTSVEASFFDSRVVCEFFEKTKFTFQTDKYSQNHTFRVHLSFPFKEPWIFRVVLATVLLSVDMHDSFPLVLSSGGYLRLSTEQ